MPYYAQQADIDSRYPGALEQAGPRDPATGELDATAIEQALDYADGVIDERLGQRWVMPWPAPVPSWLKITAVDLALYSATPSVLASDDNFKDRKIRHDAAVNRLGDIGSGKRPPPTEPVYPDGSSNAKPVVVTSRPRRNWQGNL